MIRHFWFQVVPPDWVQGVETEIAVLPELRDVAAPQFLRPVSFRLAFDLVVPLPFALPTSQPAQVLVVWFGSISVLALVLSLPSWGVLIPHAGTHFLLIVLSCFL